MPFLSKIKQQISFNTNKVNEKSRNNLRLIRFRLHLDWAEKPSVYVCHFFFFARACKTWCYCSCTVHEQQLQSLTFLTLFNQLVHTMHCSQTHKFHFSVTFLLKMDPTVLFIHLKIILQQYFSVFSFSFQLYPNGPLIQL